MAFDPNNPFGDLVPGAKPKPTVTPAAPAPAPAAAPAPAPAAPQPAAPDPNSMMLQHLGQGGIGSDQVAAPPDQGSWWDLVPGTKHWNEPAQPGPQSWFDWFSKKYNPSPSDVGTMIGSGFTYGLAPLAVQGANAVTPTGLDPDAMRKRVETASEKVGPEGPFLTAAGMMLDPLTYAGGGMAGIGGAAYRGAAKYLPDAAAAATKYLPESVAKWVPESLTPKVASAATQAGAVNAANEAGQGGSPADIAKSFGKGAAFGALVPPVLEQLPGGPVSAEDIVSKTTQAAQDAELATAGVKVPTKDLGFKVGDKADPSVADLMENREWLKTIPPEQDPAGGVPLLQKRIDQALSQSPAAPVVAEYQKAQAQADWAKTLERWGSNEGLAGQPGDVRAQAGAAAQNYPPGSPENTALQKIARVPEPADRVVSPNIRRALISGGALAGSGAESMIGLPHGGVYGVNAGNELANAIDWYFKPRGIGPAIQKQVGMGYPALTGQPGPSAGDAIRRLYGLP